MIKKASGKTVVKMSKKEWLGIGKKAGWVKKAFGPDRNTGPERQLRYLKGNLNIKDLINTSTKYLEDAGEVKRLLQANPKIDRIKIMENPSKAGGFTHAVHISYDYKSDLDPSRIIQDPDAPLAGKDRGSMLFGVRIKENGKFEAALFQD